jgi:hypothetical protein
VGRTTRKKLGMMTKEGEVDVEVTRVFKDVTADASLWMTVSLEKT